MSDGKSYPSHPQNTLMYSGIGSLRNPNGCRITPDPMLSSLLPLQSYLSFPNSMEDCRQIKPTPKPKTSVSKFHTKQLDLSHQSLKELPRSLEYNITHLNISFNELTEKHLDIVCKVATLRSLEAEGNRFQLFPQSFRELTRLKEFRFDWLSKLGLGVAGERFIREIQKRIQTGRVVEKGGVMGIDLQEFSAIFEEIRGVPLERNNCSDPPNPERRLSLKRASIQNLPCPRRTPRHFPTVHTSTDLQQHFPSNPKPSIKLKSVTLYVQSTPNTYDLQEHLIGQSLHTIFMSFDASKNWNTQRCNELISQGSDVDKYDSGGHTALHLAVMQNQIEAVRYALKMHQRTGCFDFYKRTLVDGKGLLELVCGFERVAILELLLQAGLRVQGQRVNTICAKMKKSNKVQIMERMLRKHILVSVKNQLNGSGGTNQIRSFEQNQQTSFTPVSHTPIEKMPSQRNNIDEVAKSSLFQQLKQELVRQSKQKKSYCKNMILYYETFMDY